MPKAATTPARKRAAKKASPATPPPDHENPSESGDDWFAELDASDDKANVLLWGREGSGKTTSLAMLSNLGRVLIINAEGGLKLKPLAKMGANLDNIKIFPNPKKPIPLSHANLDKMYRRVRADLMKDPDSWVAVCFDSATEVHQAILDDAQQRRIKKLEDRGQEPDVYHVDIADYGTMSKMMRDLMRKFRDLPCHVFFTALERRDIDKDTKKPTYGPAITPGLQADLLGYPDLVFMCKPEDEGGPFRALTRATVKYRAKDRFNVFPRVLVQPTGDRIIQYVTGELTEETDPFMADLPDSVSTSLDVKPDPDDDDDEDDDADE